MSFPVSVLTVLLLLGVGFAGETSLLGTELGSTGSEIVQRSYKFMAMKKDYGNAEADCWKQGGELAKITNAIENEKAIKAMGKASAALIGLSDRGDEGDWRWTDSIQLGPLGFNKWLTSKTPTNLKENCVVLETTKVGGMTLRGVWNDVDCKKERAYLCSFDSSPESKQYKRFISTLRDIGCPRFLDDNKLDISAWQKASDTAQVLKDMYATCVRVNQGGIAATKGDNLTCCGPEKRSWKKCGKGKLTCKKRASMVISQPSKMKHAGAGCCRFVGGFKRSYKNRGSMEKGPMSLAECKHACIMDPACTALDVEADQFTKKISDCYLFYNGRTLKTKQCLEIKTKHECYRKRRVDVTMQVASNTCCSAKKGSALTKQSAATSIEQCNTQCLNNDKCLAAQVLANKCNTFYEDPKSQVKPARIGSFNGKGECGKGELKLCYIKKTVEKGTKIEGELPQKVLIGAMIGVSVFLVGAWLWMPKQNKENIVYDRLMSINDMDTL